MNKVLHNSGLSSVTQDYIKTIWSFYEKSLAPVTTKMLAEKLSTSPSTASETIKRLVDQELVNHQRYGSISLTGKGTSLALSIVRKHRLVETFLVKVLDYPWDKIHEEAEILEHAISDSLIDAIDKKLGYPDRDPHGDPIPRKDGTLPDVKEILLTTLAPGHSGKVVRISDSDPQILRYFDTLNLSLDSSIEVIESRPYAGTITIRINGGKLLDLGIVAAESIWLHSLTIDNSIFSKDL